MTSLKHWLREAEQSLVEPDAITVDPDPDRDDDGAADPAPPFKVGDWVYSDIAKDTSRIVGHDPVPKARIGGNNFYTVQWSDGTRTKEVPQNTLKRSGTPAKPTPVVDEPPAAKGPPPAQQRLVTSVVKGRKPVIIDPAASIYTAAQLIAKNNVGALPVLVHDRLIGILSERDIVSRVVALNQDAKVVKVYQAMTADPVTITGQDSVSKAQQLMSRGGFRHLPVVENGAVVSVLSIRDVIDQ